MAEINTASLKLLYNGTDISEDLLKYLSSFSVIGAVGENADDLQICLENREGFWSGSWSPQKGAILEAEIHSFMNGTKKYLKCGTFAIDEITVSGPPDTVVLKAVSSLTSKAMKQEKKSKGWEDVSLFQIARNIADQHDLTLWADIAEPPVYARQDQREESDLAFLNRLCRDEDLNLKLTGDKIVISQGKTLEETAAFTTIERGVTVFETYSFVSKTYDIFRACEVKYFDPVTKQVKKHTYTPPGALDAGQILKINQRVESLGQAIAKARGALRRKNSQEIKVNFTIMGDPDFQAGMTFNKTGFGIFDGKYLIEDSKHVYTKQAGYKTTCRARKVLNW